MAADGVHAKWSTYLAGLEKDSAKLGREDDLMTGNKVAGLPPAPWNSADDASRFDAQGNDGAPDFGGSGVGGTGFADTPSPSDHI